MVYLNGWRKFNVVIEDRIRRFSKSNKVRFLVFGLIFKEFRYYFFYFYNKRKVEEIEN